MPNSTAENNLNPQQNSTVVGGWSVAVSRALDALGYHGDELLKRAGIDLSEKFNVDARFSANHTRVLWQLALEETGQENIGLQVAQFVCPTTFHALGFSLWASNSLYDALQRMVRFEILLNSGCHLQISIQDDTTMESSDQREKSQINNNLCFIMDIKQQNGEALVTAQGVDYFLGAIVKMFRDMSSPSFAPIEVHLTRPTPRNIKLWQDYFQCPVYFNTLQNQLIFPIKSLKNSLPTGNAILAEQNDKLVESYLSRLEMQDICGQVRSSLIELMPLGITTLEGIAEALSMPPRTLQYKLNQQGTSLQKLRDSIREELARQYLQYSRQPFTQIAYSLGFSDPAHFNRAFKRWTGETPTFYRRRTY